MNRRTFFFASSGALAGSLAVSGLAEAEEPADSLYAGSGLITGAPKPLRHKEVPGFLSAAQIAPHHSSHYGGALKAFTGVEQKLEASFTKGVALDSAAFERMKQLQSSRGDSVILHELYFDGLSLCLQQRHRKALRRPSRNDSVRSTVGQPTLLPVRKRRRAGRC